MVMLSIDCGSKLMILNTVMPIAPPPFFLNYFKEMFLLDNPYILIYYQDFQNPFHFF